MTTLAAACLRHDGYESPELNESLYLHFRGFMRIENLEPYTSVKALFLESNNLRRIEGVEHLSSLRALFLQQVSDRNDKICPSYCSRGA